MTIFSFELFSVLFTIMIIVKFKLNKKFVLWLLRGVKIYLPPTDQDNELIKEMKKNKNQIRNKKGDALVRTCEVYEYINGIKDDNYTESDVIIFFYLTTLFNLLIIEVDKIFEIFFNVEESDSKDYNINTINIAVSFALITVTYLLYSIFKSNFKSGFNSYDARLFYLLQFSFFSISIITLSYFDNIIAIDYDNICNIINDRVFRITDKASEVGNHENLKYNEIEKSGICNKPFIKIFFSFVFSFIISIMYRGSTNLAEFDNLILNITNKSKSDKGVGKNFNLGKIYWAIKIKQILNIAIFFLLLDPLLKNVLIERKYISDISYHLIIILPTIFFEMILGFYCVRCYAESFLESNYYDTVSYCENPTTEALIFLRKKITKVNTMFWEIFIRIFYMTFISFLLFILYINRANAILYINDENFKFRTNFLDSLMYIWLLGTYAAKGIFYNSYLYYLQNYNRNKPIFTI